MGLHRSRIDFQALAEQPMRFIKPSALKFDQPKQVERIELLFVRRQHQATVEFGFANMAPAMRDHRLSQRIDGRRLLAAKIIRPDAHLITS